MNKRAAAITTVALMVAAGLLLLAACGGGEPADEGVQPTGSPLPSTPTTTAGEERTPAENEIVLSSSSFPGPESYAFTSEVQMTSGLNQQTFHFEGIFEPPDRVQGTLHVTGEGWARSGRPSDMEVVFVQRQASWREEGGEWQAEGTPGEPGVLGTLCIVGTPMFYLHAYQFDALRLPTTGPGEEVNRVDSWLVELDKDTLLSIAKEGTFSASEGYSDTVDEEALDAIPDDLLIQTWIAKDGLYPVRIIVSMQGESGDRLPWLVFYQPAEVRVQIDILGPAPDVGIEPPPTAGR